MDVRLGALLVALVCPTAVAQSVKVSAPMPYGPLANGENIFETGLAGPRVVYRADQDEHGKVELYSAPLDGSQPPVKLNRPLPSGGDVLSFVVGPGGDTAIFLSTGVPNGPGVLYRVPSDGSTPAVQIASPVREGPVFTPDGASVVYRKGSGITDDLWIAPLGGGSARLLATDVDSFVVGPDGQNAVFRRAYTTGLLLFSVPLDGSHAPIALDGLRGEFEVRILPGEHWVVYRANAATGASSEIHDLYGVPMDGSQPPVKLNPNLTSTRHVQEFELTPDGTRVVYVADQTRAGRNELFSVPADGSAPSVRLVQVRAFADVAGAPPFVITPDGRDVVFRADNDQDESFRLYRVSVLGGAEPARLTSVAVDQYAVAPDGLRLVYLARESPAVAELFRQLLPRIPPARSLGGAPYAPAPVRLNGPLVPGGTVLGFELTPDGESVVYHARQDSLQAELYRVPLAGGAPPVKLSGPLVAGGDVGGNLGPPYRVSADSSRVLYQADQDTDLLVELYGVPVDGGQAPVKLNGPLDLGPRAGDVREFRFSPDGARFAYVADGTVDDVFELYGGDVGGAQPVASLSLGLGYPGPWSFSRDGARVVFCEPLAGSSQRNLYSVLSDGSASPLLLENGSADIGEFALAPGGSDLVFVQDALFAVPLAGGVDPVLLSGSVLLPSRPEIAPDGRRVVFDQNEFPNEPLLRIFAAPMDAGAPPLELSGALVFGGSTRQRAISPRGERVVFLADKEVRDRVELYSVPIDGRVAPMKLSRALVAEGDVTRFAISPQGTRVVYQADQELDRHQELYSVSIDGAPHVQRPGGPARAPRVKLNGPLPPGTDTGVRDFAIDPTGASVAFTLQDGAQAAQLYGVPIERSADPVLLSPGASDVRLFAFSPDGARVVYSAYGAMPGALELFSAPVDGSQAPVRLNGPLVSGGSLQLAALGGYFAISPDGRWVVYMADQDVDERVELYARALDGAGSPLRLNDPLGPEADVRGMFGYERAFAISPDSSCVLYSADQDEDEVVELYRVPLP